MQHAAETLQHRIAVALLMWANTSDEAIADLYMRDIIMFRKRLRALRWRMFWTNLLGLEMFT
jgi:hypothetical protein